LILESTLKLERTPVLKTQERYPVILVVVVAKIMVVNPALNREIAVCNPCKKKRSEVVSPGHNKSWEVTSGEHLKLWN
jgi:hypothetical protein